ncbi:MAG: putative CAMK/RAD53 protein kinase Cds1, partial [Streblomastix strix]
LNEIFIYQFDQWKIQPAIMEEDLLESQGFEILKSVGEGAFGQVYLVDHPDKGIFAAKVMRNEDFDENYWLVTVILNSDLTNICPFIVRNILARKLQDMTIILMEYSNLGNLKTLINENYDIPFPILQDLMKKILEGLKYIHSKGIIHRDIKGGNILLHNPSDSGRVILKICDFGEVKIKEEDEQFTLMTAAGTRSYMAPELFLGNENEMKKADEKVDMWSLGILFYLIVVHEMPFKSQTYEDINEFLTSKILQRPPSITDNDLWDLLKNMLSFDPLTRISAADALNHPFFTSDPAKADITQEQKQLALFAQQAQQRGDLEITEFDTDPSYIFPLKDVYRILGQDNLDSDNSQSSRRSSHSPSSSVQQSFQANRHSQQLQQQDQHQYNSESPPNQANQSFFQVIHSYNSIINNMLIWMCELGNK